MIRMPKNMRFMTEFGAQSFPNLESCLKFMPAEPQAMDFDHLATRHCFQPEVMARWLRWRDAPTLQALIDMSQDYQIFINRYYIDRLRYHKYRPTGGIVPFMFHDPYPAILWSIIDYWRVPKRSYYAMQMALCPHYAFTLIAPRTFRLAEPITLPVYAVNDSRYPVEVQLVASLCDPAHAEIATISHTLTLEADCLAQEVDRLRLTPSQRGWYTLRVQLHSPDFETDQTYEVEVS
jgi:beta-mannosidase